MTDYKAERERVMSLLSGITKRRWRVVDATVYALNVHGHNCMSATFQPAYDDNGLVTSQAELEANATLAGQAPALAQSYADLLGQHAEMRDVLVTLLPLLDLALETMPQGYILKELRQKARELTGAT